MSDQEPAKVMRYLCWANKMREDAPRYQADNCGGLPRYVDESDYLAIEQAHAGVTAKLAELETNHARLLDIHVAITSYCPIQDDDTSVADAVGRLKAERDALIADNAALDGAIIKFLEDISYLPPWESAGVLWAQKCQNLNRARLGYSQWGTALLEEVKALKEQIEDHASALALERGCRPIVAKQIKTLEQTITALVEALEAARNELGVPQLGCPMSVANAAKIIKTVLASPEVTKWRTK